MIPRYQKIVFAVLLLVSIGMAAVLVRLRERAHDRLLAGQDDSPTTAPAVAPAESATLMVANDMDGTLLTQQRSLPLPRDPEARAGAVLDKLFEIYAAPGAMHPVPAQPRGIAQVFLLPMPARTEGRGPTSGPTSGPNGGPAQLEGGQLAVVNLAGALADAHPAGIETETLTVDSICATLRANLPQVRAVRFLVDGEPRATLAGHADLTRTYLTGELMSAHPSGAGTTDQTAEAQP